MNHIFNIRSTNGGGKTTLARAVMSKMDYHQDYTTKNGVLCHVFKTPRDESVAVIGKYDKSATGGVDRVKNVRDVIEACAEVSQYGHIMMEGLIMSGLQQLTKDIADACPNATLHALALDTPLAKCIEQCLKRRAEAGNDKPFDPSKSLTPKYRAVELAVAKLALWGVDSRWISQQDAYVEICDTLQLPWSNDDPIMKGVKK